MRIFRFLTFRIPRQAGLAVAVLCIALAVMIPRPAQAEDETPLPPERKVTLTVNLTETEWWLAYYQDNQVACRLWVEHDGLPTAAEIYSGCGTAVFRDWQASKPCTLQGGDQDLKRCSGIYFQKIAERPIQKQIEVTLSLPTVWISLEGCGTTNAEGRCSGMPYLHLQGEESLPNEHIIRINGSINGETFSCPGSECDLHLPPTGERGETLEFWADSSYGDSSPRFSALIRIIPWGNFTAPEGPAGDPQQWYVDLLSSQWRGGSAPSCAASWRVLPDLGGPPAWLRSPQTPQELATDLSYYYLAAMLIQNGAVDASACPNHGLESSDVANACGVAAAEPKVMEWQNRFDAEILSAALETGVPAQLLKNVFSRESQLWPGIYRTYAEAGLGQLTENGADAVLLWNPDFYRQFCPLVLSAETCQLGFGNLEPAYQAMLRGALVRKANAACPDCPLGIDLRAADFSVRIFAQGLIGNCEQVAQLFYNLTDGWGGEYSSYIDLWKFTLVNYNAGPGCLSTALRRTWDNGDPLDWEHVSANLDPGCQAAIGYVEDITSVGLPTPTPTSWVQFITPQPIGPTGTPLPTPTRSMGTPTPTPTEEPYPPPGEETPEPYPYPYTYP